MDIVERFLKYVSFCTTSDENTGMTPSTPGQMDFARYLADELKNIGLTEVSLDSNGYIMATLEANNQSPITHDRFYRPYGYLSRRERQTCEAEYHSL